MKGCAGAIGALFGLLILGAVAYWFVLPRVKPGAAKPPATETAGPTTEPSPDRSNPHPGEAIKTPPTAAEQLRADINKKRIPFFHYLHDNYSDVIESSRVLDEMETLDVVVKKADENTLTGLVSAAIAPSAKEYAFNRVRFYLRNPVGSVDPFKVVAESTYDGSGHWNTFFK